MAMELPVRLAVIAAAILLGGVSLPGVTSTLTHQPKFDCVSSGSLRITCHGSFIDGTSAAGIVVRVLDKQGRIVYVGTVDRLGRITFRKPDAEFNVVFDAGEGNVLTISGSDVI
jgi:hypothetical protein